MIVIHSPKLLDQPLDTLGLADHEMRRPYCDFLNGEASGTGSEGSFLLSPKALKSKCHKRWGSKISQPGVPKLAQMAVWD